MIMSRSSESTHDPAGESIPVQEGGRGEPGAGEAIQEIAFDRSVCMAPEDEKACLDYFSMLEESVKDETMFIGKGGAGKVFSVSNTGFCIKVVPVRNAATADGVAFDLGNAPRVEARLQQRVQALQRARARVPACLRVVEGGEHVGIVMEKLNACNLEEVLQGVEQLPATYNHGSFFDALADFLQVMHEDAEVGHGDLYPRNVMVDRETGAAYVIDFGRSSLLSDLDAGRRREIAEQDWDQYDTVEAELYAYCQKQGLTKTNKHE